MSLWVRGGAPHFLPDELLLSIVAVTYDPLKQNINATVTHNRGVI